MTSLARRPLVVRLTLLSLLALPLAPAAALSEPRVLLEPGRVTIRSESAPLADVLSRFAQATGAELVYEAARPRQLVSVAIEAASPAEAIARLLEGQGLNYALRLDPSGRRVEMLVVTSSSSPAASTARPSHPAPAFPAPAAEESDEVPQGAETEPPESAAPASSSGAPGEGALVPGPGAPFFGPPPETPAGSEPSAPGTSSPPEPQPALPGLQPAQPQPPAAASYPGSPAPPVYPGPASYPPPGAQ